MAYPNIDIPPPGDKKKPVIAKPMKRPAPSAALNSTGLRVTREMQATSGPMDAIMEQLVGLDPIERALVKAPIERALSSVTGRQYVIPEPEEWALQKQQREEAFWTQQDNLIKRRVMDLQAAIADAGPELKATTGVDVNTLGSDPEAWVQFVQQQGAGLTLGDLMRVGMAEMPTEGESLEAAAKEGREAVSLAETTVKRAQTVKDVASGTGDLGPIAKKLKENIFASKGADMEFLDTDFDEGGGSAALLDYRDALQGSEIGQIIRKKGVAAAIIEDFGGDIVDALEDAPKDEMGRIITGTGGELLDSVDKDAVFHLLTLVQSLANDLDVAPADILRGRLGIEGATDVEPNSYKAELERRTGGDKKKMAEFAAKYGLRLK
jgi:hypothetical protein